MAIKRVDCSLVKYQGVDYYVHDGTLMLAYIGSVRKRNQATTTQSIKSNSGAIHLRCTCSHNNNRRPSINSGKYTLHTMEQVPGSSSPHSRLLRPSPPPSSRQFRAIFCVNTFTSGLRDFDRYQSHFALPSQPTSLLFCSALPSRSHEQAEIRPAHQMKSGAYIRDHLYSSLPHHVCPF